MRLSTVFLMISLALCGGVVAAQDTPTPAKPTKMYKWTDENGTVHYSSEAADATAAQEVQLRRGPATPPVGPVAAVADPEQVKRCEQLRKNLDLLESDASDLQIEDNGKLRPLTAEERAPQLKSTREAWDRCKSVPVPPK